MDFFIDLLLLAVVVIGCTAFLGSISAFIIRLFIPKNKAHISIAHGEKSKMGWRRLQR